MSSTLAKVRAAEQLLFDLACDLRLVAVAPGTAHLHVRALEMKRKVHAWQSVLPEEAAVDSVLMELEELAREVQGHRSQVRPSRQLACSVGSRRPSSAIGAVAYAASDRTSGTDCSRSGS